MKLIAEAIFLFLAFLDLEFTKTAIREHGIRIELNPAIQGLVSKMGIPWGVGLGILVPTAVFTIAGWYETHILAFMLGVRVLLASFQLRSRI